MARALLLRYTVANRCHVFPCPFGPCRGFLAVGAGASSTQPMKVARFLKSCGSADRLADLSLASCSLSIGGGDIESKPDQYPSMKLPYLLGQHVLAWFKNDGSFPRRWAYPGQPDGFFPFCVDRTVRMWDPIHSGRNADPCPLCVHDKGLHPR